ncbi:MAG TPA: head-tail adaptor protein [Kaistia sp.]|nr:head-tail adaptor protein [Kaistia sp.]
MNIGNLDRIAELHRDIPTGERDELNEPITVDTVVATFRLGQTIKATDERFAAEQRYGERVVTFSAWWRPDITETDRLKVDGVTFEILGLSEIGRRQGLEISAKAINP